MTTTEHQHYRLRGYPMLDGVWVYQCTDCDLMTSGTPEQIGPDGDVRVALIAVLGMLLMGAGVIGLVTAAFVHSGAMALSGLGSLAGGVLVFMWAWRNGVDR